MKRKVIRVLLSGLVCLAFVFGLFGCNEKGLPETASEPASTPTSTSAPEVIKWDMQTMLPPTSLTTKYFGQDWAEYIERITQGRIQIEFHPSGTFAEGDQCIVALGKGMFDVLVGNCHLWSNQVMVSSVEEGCYFTWQEPWEVWDAYYNYGLFDVVQERYAEKNIYPVSCACGWNIANIGTKFPITKLDDIKGKKIFAMGNDALFVSALGAQITTIAVTDLYMALSTGVTDGCFWGLGGLETYKLAEAGINHFIMKPFINPLGTSSNPYINMDSWNALPDDLKELITESTRYFYLEQATKVHISDMETASWAVQNGVTLVELPPEDVAKAQSISIPLWDEIAKKDEYCAQGVEILKQQMRDYGRIE